MTLPAIRFVRPRKLLSALAVSALAAATMAATAAGGAADAPPPRADVPVDATIEVGAGEVFDGNNDRYFGVGDLGDGGQGEDQPAMFELADGATLSDVVIGAPAADGVHCLGACTLRNVVWEDVGEDAATFKGEDAGATMTIEGGSAARAEDKVFQHNGAGTVIIRNFAVSGFGKLYRACGNCGNNPQERHVRLENVTATAPGGSLAGINVNYGDTATFSGITVAGDREMEICGWYEGVTDGEPDHVGSGPSDQCKYDPDDIRYE
ncbi:pectate lyase [Saccharopolyspora erythraea]|uniref:pectate lyase n=1 Tax=Saccharopolyspora erythraea TaxID=1836 RepID=UPI001BA45565|nr:pectate lyase [Saccharopolyspora erythraea]QUH02307.1 pectate lyase [Saccharopolyspora erythraea]